MHCAPTLTLIEIEHIQGSASTIYKNDHVIANEVKQSHSSKFRLLSLPVRVRTQTGRFTPRKDNFPNLQFTINDLRTCNLPLDTCNWHMSIPIYLSTYLYGSLLDIYE
jgi:hypothetical protein